MENMSVHGTLVSVFGVGVLITGESGCGKSECALELISRGHILIADDAVFVERREAGLTGSSPQHLFGLLDVRGLGICNIRQLYGESFAEQGCSIDAVLEFRSAFIDPDPDRILGDLKEMEILGIHVPLFIISGSTTRSLPVIVETAARLIKNGGQTADVELIERHNTAIAG